MHAGDAQVLGIVLRAAAGDGRVGDAAREAGVSARDLRRKIRNAFDTTPVEVLQACRIAGARRRLDRSTRPVVEIAFESGFRSLRRFNAAFRSAYGCTPSEARTRGNLEGRETLVLSRPGGAVSWEKRLEAQRKRCRFEEERVCGGAYVRAQRIGRGRGWIALYGAPRRRVRVEISLSLAPHLVEIVRRVDALLAGPPDAAFPGGGADAELGRALFERFGKIPA